MEEFSTVKEIKCIQKPADVSADAKPCFERNISLVHNSSEIPKSRIAFGALFPLKIG